MKCADYSNTLSLQMIYAGHSVVGKEWCYKNTISPFTRIYLIDKGRGAVYMDGKKYELHEGGMFIIPKFTFHEYECNDFMSHYYICFIDRLVGGRNLFEYADINYTPQASEMDKLLMKRFMELNPGCAISDPNPQAYDNRPELFSINRESRAGNVRNDIESNGILLQLFSRFLNDNANAATFPSKISLRMMQVLNYIHNHLSQGVNIAQLAEIMCVSPDHFIRVFKKVNGLTPNQYIQHERVERAQTMMLSSDMDIIEIARRVGVPNPSQFSKLFSKHTGMSPTEYISFINTLHVQNQHGNP